MNIKKAIAASISLAVLCVSAPWDMHISENVRVTASAEETSPAQSTTISVSENSGDFNGVNWELSDGILTFNGEGELKSASSYPWAGEEINQLVAGEGVTFLSSSVIASAGSIKSVKIMHPACDFEANSFPKNVEIQGYEKSTAALIAEEHGNSFKSLGQYDNTPIYSEKSGVWSTWSIDKFGILTFSGTGSVPSHKMDTKSKWVAKYRDQIRGVIIENGITKIGEMGFGGSENLETDIPNLLFAYIPSSVTLINDSAFLFEKKLQWIKIDEGVETIGVCCFMGCTSLRKITIPKSIQLVQYDAFVECPSLTEVTILNPVCKINQGDSNKGTTIPSSIRGYAAGVYTIEDQKWGIYSPEMYAKKFGRTFIPITSDSETTTTASTTVTTSALTTTTATTSTVSSVQSTTQSSAVTTQTSTSAVTVTSQSAVTSSSVQPTNNTSSVITTTTTTSTENDILYGDANSDGKVSIPDATAILQYIANRDKYKLTEKGMINADCCDIGDGITAKDALAIQKLDAKILDKLPV